MTPILKRARYVLLLVVVTLGACVAYLFYRGKSEPFDRLAAIASVAPGSAVDCAVFTRGRPLVLLALGQSNAGNHGALAKSPDAPIAMVAGADCVLAEDPLPGATGAGGSIWRHLPALLSTTLAGRTVVMSVLAIDATTMDDWTHPGSLIALRLTDQVSELRRKGLNPDLILWQQGEADARKGTPDAQYLDGLQKLASLLERAGSRAPIMLAKSTVCRSTPAEALRLAIDQAPKADARFLAGPDTDALLGDKYRHDGCHLTSVGLKTAARQWADVITTRLAALAPGS